MASQSQKENTSPSPSPSPTVSELIKLNQMGVISTGKLRRLVAQLFPASPTKVSPLERSPSQSPPRLSSKSKLRNQLRWRPTRALTFADEDAEIDAAVNRKRQFVTAPRKPKKKARREPSSPKTIELRDLAKNPTRRRFFRQCCKTDSLLWQRTASGGQTLHKLLFARAAQDPVAELYQRYPGTTYSVPGTKLMKAVKWRVCKDRNNWMGKTPKRQLFAGAESEFNWEEVHAKLQKITEMSSCNHLSR